MIEVFHNPDSLLHRRTLHVKNPRLAYERLQAIMESKRPKGLRVRHGLDLPTSRILLETRTSIAMDTIVCALRDGGFIK